MYLSNLHAWKLESFVKHAVNTHYIVKQNDKLLTSGEDWGGTMDYD